LDFENLNVSFFIHYYTYATSNVTVWGKSGPDGAQRGRERLASPPVRARD